MENKRLNNLFELYSKGEASESQINELVLLLKEASDEELSQILSKAWNDHAITSAPISLEMKQRLLVKIQPNEDPQATISLRNFSNRRVWIRIAAAAAVLAIVCVSGFFLLKNKSEQPVAKKEQEKTPVNDVAPGGNRAILTLANGKEIILDTATNGALAHQGDIKIIKIGAQVSYKRDGGSGEVLYNTITTPKGGQYQLELADGSKVWLNAASSLKFPTSFVGGERKVELTGEAYFEVTHNAAMPFHVTVNNIDVTVLGTHFNINSYTDEPEIKTTLLEGRVMVKNSASYVYLNPGQQAKSNGSEIKIDNDADLDEVMAWKNGYFSFNNADIKSLMRQLSRWYDIDVVYEGNNDQTFSGKIDRNLTLRDLLDGLGQTIHYRIESGGKLVILP